MEKQSLIKKIEKQAYKFKQRANKGHVDEKRHDRILRDEQKAMWDAHSISGWSFSKIGSIFERDPRGVKKAVETYKEQTLELASQQDPIIIEAKRKHFEQIASLLETWGEELKIVRKMDCFESTVITYKVENEALFEAVLQHFPSIDQRYQDMKLKRQEFETLEGKLTERISEEAPAGAIEPDFSRTAVRCAFWAAQYVPTEQVPSYHPDYEITIESDLVVIRAESRIVIARRDRDLSYQELHEKLINKYIGSDEVSRMVQDAKSLLKIQVELANIVQSILLRQEWINTRCDYCPGKTGAAKRYHQKV